MRSAGPRGRRLSGVGALAVALAPVATGAVVASLAPAWILPLVVLVLPLRLEVGAGADLPTLVLLGGALGRAPALARAAARQPLAAAAFAALPVWVAVSGLWARQPLFAAREAAKWAAVSLAALLALADERRDPRPLVAAACLALVPSAGWAIAERLGLLPPRGDPEELRLRLIDVGGLVRGRALFYHPNRLAEFVEQLGLLLVACAVWGPLAVAATAGALLAVAGTWASGSTAGIAVMTGGGLVAAASFLAWRARTRRAAGRSAERVGAGRGVAVAIALAATAAVAGAVVVVAYQVHGGLGPRAIVYREAWQVIRRAPLLGVGGGNWGFEMASEPMRRFWFAGHTHSLVLQLWVELGLIGVLVGAVFFGVPIALGVRGAARADPTWRGIAAGACAGVLAVLAHDLVHYFLREPADGLLTGVLLGLAAASARPPAAGERAP